MPQPFTRKHFYSYLFKTLPIQLSVKICVNWASRQIWRCLFAKFAKSMVGKHDAKAWLPGSCSKYSQTALELQCSERPYVLLEVKGPFGPRLRPSRPLGTQAARPTQVTEKPSWFLALFVIFGIFFESLAFTVIFGIFLDFRHFPSFSVFSVIFRIFRYFCHFLWFFAFSAIFWIFPNFWHFPWLFNDFLHFPWLLAFPVIIDIFRDFGHFPWFSAFSVIFGIFVWFLAFSVIFGRTDKENLGFQSRAFSI